MMNALEQEIIEKFHQLDTDAQKRVRALIGQETGSEQQAEEQTFDYDAWFRDVETLRQLGHLMNLGKMPDSFRIMLFSIARNTLHSVHNCTYSTFLGGESADLCRVCRVV